MYLHETKKVNRPLQYRHNLAIITGMLVAWLQACLAFYERRSRQGVASLSWFGVTMDRIRRSVGGKQHLPLASAKGTFFFPLAKLDGIRYCYEQFTSDQTLGPSGYAVCPSPNQQKKPFGKTSAAARAM